MVIGDFNAVLNADDRIGGKEVTWAEVVDFHNCVMECGLMELPAQGNRFLAEGISDHCPAKVTFVEERQRIRRSFQFCNIWAKHPQFMRTAFNNILTETNEDRANLKKAQEQLQRRPLNVEYQQAEAKAYQKFRNSSYLAEAVTQIKDSSGNWLTDPDRIADTFVEYYENLLGRTTSERVMTFRSIIRNGSRLSETLQDELIQPFSRREVKQAMFQIDINKSPGPYGFGSGFYKAAWPIVGGDITETILEFFQNGRLLRQINTINIALIPKVEVP
uniref:Uncharacterized protein LOC104229377 n=1 Tax=Nicotiana sylvestris TaxID=4096 RepID=A0A1U7WP12_NICSY|nr:PREDICTED: uncharacterized protein LOC104229377 [Nicotiana sylvestris]